MPGDKERQARERLSYILDMAARSNNPNPARTSVPSVRKNKLQQTPMRRQQQHEYSSRTKTSGSRWVPPRSLASVAPTTRQLLDLSQPIAAASGATFIPMSEPTGGGRRRTALSVGLKLQQERREDCIDASNTMRPFGHPSSRARSSSFVAPISSRQRLPQRKSVSIVDPHSRGEDDCEEDAEAASDEDAAVGHAGHDQAAYCVYPSWWGHEEHTPSVLPRPSRDRSRRSVASSSSEFIVGNERSKGLNRRNGTLRGRSLERKNTLRMDRAKKILVHRKRTVTVADKATSTDDDCDDCDEEFDLSDSDEGDSYRSEMPSLNGLDVKSFSEIVVRKVLREVFDQQAHSNRSPSGAFSKHGIENLQGLRSVKDMNSSWINFHGPDVNGNSSRSGSQQRKKLEKSLSRSPQSRYEAKPSWRSDRLESGQARERSKYVEQSRSTEKFRGGSVEGHRDLRVRGAFGSEHYHVPGSGIGKTAKKEGSRDAVIEKRASMHPDSNSRKVREAGGDGTKREPARARAEARSVTTATARVRDMVNAYLGNARIMEALDMDCLRDSGDDSN
ncbi:hypothetical protein HDU82_008854 [Entophlyctis luteolus]|nr:hypothetical protein HDU82_008854 [Entophlyctis luteolus]